MSKARIVQVLTAIALVISVFTGVWAIDDRYVLADDFKSHLVYSEISELESRLERLQDKLVSFLSIPPEERRQWQREEVIRLQQQIERITAKIERLG